jgi:hypothetical protein
MVNLKYLIVSCARSGSGYMNKLFNENGIKCGHEKIFDTIIRQNIHKNEAESSWLSAPFLHLLLNNDCKIIWLKRNPIHVIKSLLELNSFNAERFLSSPYVKHKVNNTESVRKENDSLTNCINYYIEWNELIQKNINGKNYIKVKLEDIIDKKSVILFDKEFKTVNEKINTKTESKRSIIYEDELIERIKKLNGGKTYKKLFNTYNM